MTEELLWSGIDVEIRKIGLYRVVFFCFLVYNYYMVNRYA